MKISEKKIFGRACFYLSRKIRTESEVKKYILKTFNNFDVTEDTVYRVIEKLKSYNYINDESYVEAFVKSALSKKSKSSLLLKRELLSKGVSPEIIDNFFLNNPVSNKDLALKTLKLIWPRYANLDPEKQKRRLIQLLLRRGFTFEEAINSLKTIKNNTNIEEN